MNSVDLSYNSRAHDLTLNVLWSRALDEIGWGEQETKDDLSEEKFEVGVLNSESAADPGDLKMGGYLASVGEDEKMSMSLPFSPCRVLSVRTHAILIPVAPSPTAR